jgi:glycine dehydrogenase subunit 1
VAETSMARTRELVAALTAVRGVRALFSGEGFHEAVLGFDRPVAPLLAALAQRGIQGGLDLTERFPELGPSLLVCATETKTSEDIARYARAVDELQNPAAFARGAA